MMTGEVEECFQPPPTHPPPAGDVLHKSWMDDGSNGSREGQSKENSHFECLKMCGKGEGRKTIYPENKLGT